MRLLLLLSFSILFTSATFSYPTYGTGILEILVESGASIHARFVVIYENKSQVTWRQLKPNTPELLIFEGFNVSQKLLNIFDLSNRSELMNVTIHDNLTSSSVLFNPLSDRLYDFDHQPLPYIGFEMKIKCAKDWYGIGCHKHCSMKQEGTRCDKSGRPACILGYCGWNCHKSGSECQSYFANCNCKNGGKCYAGEYSTRCQCPLGYTGDNCERFEKFEETLYFETNYGFPIMLPSTFSNRTDFQHLFDYYEMQLGTSGQQDTQMFQLLGSLGAICVLILAMSGYCIYKFCGGSENEEKILDASGDEEKKCILIGMNDM